MTVVKEPEFLHFQTLVDQARTRIQSYCPEWTELNLSDPGVTLIELFAYMTSQLNYRLNRIPERNYLEFLKLVGISPEPPQPARTELTFYLSVPFPLVRVTGELDDSIETRIPANTMVATRRATGEEEEIIFITERAGIIRPPRLQQVRRIYKETDLDGHFQDEYLISRPQGGGTFYQLDQQGFYPFHKDTPRIGNAFYLEFDPEFDVAGYYLILDLACQGQGVGINPDKPPLLWECSLGEDRPPDKAWKKIPWQEDTTRGLTGDGQIRLHLPTEMKPATIQGINAYWLRCRLFKDETDESQMMYTESPLINDLRVFVAGLTIPAVHSAPIREPEILGRSSGEPGQYFQLRRYPVLPLDPAWNEYVEVEERYAGEVSEFVRWEQVEDFANSNRYDRHYTLDLHEGLISFGPAVRQPDGKMRQCGQIPKLRHRIQVTRYRTGGGAHGNVPAGSLRILKKAINYIVEVNNRFPASGGRDQENLETTRLRAREILRGRLRAVTAEDYEWLCSREEFIARVKCLEPGMGEVAEPGRVRLLIVPQAVRETDKQPEDKQPEDKLSPSPNSETLRHRLNQLKVDDSLKKRVCLALEPYRLLGITLDIREPAYVGVKIRATVSSKPHYNSDAVRDEVIQRLRDFITPLKTVSQEEQTAVHNGQMPKPAGASLLAEGWPFGQPLYISDVYATIKAIDGVAYVTGVKLCWCPLDLHDERSYTRPRWSEEAVDVIETQEYGLLYLLDCEVQLDERRR